MSLAVLSIAFIALLSLGYSLYGRWVAKQFKLDPSVVTPAHLRRDGVDYEPTAPFYLFGQHFSAIAAAGPIAGPIIAGQLFGWGPSLLWIALGVVLIGAVHDFSTLVASLRHGACSIAEITVERLGKSAGWAMMAFIWVALVYIIVAFSDITATSFVSAIEEIQGVHINFNPGGAVAAASIFYLGLAMVLGLVQRFLRPPVWLITIVFVPLIFVVCWSGTWVSELFLLSTRTWGTLIVIYCGLASLIPMWLLLQPRGFLGGFVLYFALAVGLMGIFFGGATIEQPFFISWNVGGATGGLFPFLFVTIACGACSGFHGLVCSGTTSKQIDRENHAQPVGFGAMLAEGFVAFIALAIFMSSRPEEIAGLKPGTIYGNGIGKFLCLILGKENLPFAITLGAMAFSTFVFDTLDVSARLGRYLVQELTGWKGKGGALFGTFITCFVPGVILFYAPEGGWIKFWTLFGASNQLLAALSLLAVTVWLNERKARIAFTLVPMLFVLITTLYALIQLFLANIRGSQGLDVQALNALAAAALILLALFINATALKKVWTKRLVS